MNQFASPWTEARDALLTELAAKGHSASQIGAAMGFTRNSIISRARRIGAQLKGRPVAPRRAPKTIQANARSTRVKRMREDRQKRLPQPEGPPLALLPTEPQDGPYVSNAGHWRALPGSSPVTLLEIGTGDCRWPVSIHGDTGFRFCALPVEPSKVYCRQHRIWSEPKQ